MATLDDYRNALTTLAHFDTLIAFLALLMMVGFSFSTGLALGMFMEGRRIRNLWRTYRRGRDMHRHPHRHDRDAPR